RLHHPGHLIMARLRLRSKLTVPVMQRTRRSGRHFAKFILALRDPNPYLAAPCRPPARAGDLPGPRATRSIGDGASEPAAQVALSGSAHTRSGNLWRSAPRLAEHAAVDHAARDAGPPPGHRDHPAERVAHAPQAAGAEYRFSIRTGAFRRAPGHGRRAPD